jgi:hypothetical protein
MKIPTGTSFASDHRFGVRAGWPFRALADADNGADPAEMESEPVGSE